MHLRLPRSRACRQGAATVEMAIITPLLVLMFLGMVEMGRAFSLQQTVTNAAREGARFAVRSDHAVTEEDVRNYVINYLENPEAGAARIQRSAMTTFQMTTQGSGGNSAAIRPYTPVRVRLGIDYADAAWLPRLFFIDQLTIEATVVMRKEP